MVSSGFSHALNNIILPSCNGASIGNEEFFENTYISRETSVERKNDGSLVAKPIQREYTLRTRIKPNKLGVMLVGWGGNNGSTLTAALLANKRNLSWETKSKANQTANFYGSLVLASTLKLGTDSTTGEDIHVPFSNLAPFASPTEVVIGGWDLSRMDLGTALDRSAVLEPDLKRQLRQEMQSMKPLPSIYYPSWIAANQESRADNLIDTREIANSDHLETIRSHIREFKASNSLDLVVVLWTANTERFAEIIPGQNDTAEALLESIKNGNCSEISPSCMFAVASLLEGCPFINGSPQNTCVPGVIELASKVENGFLGGDDFKSGQTKVKSVLVDYLVSAGIKPIAITSYNHLGNNDGMNLSAPSQFRSKEISKTNVVDDMVGSNSLLYQKGEHPDHTVVIKYVPAVGDSKRALDEYESEIFMGGRNTLSIYNVCEDSLLAVPLILDLILLTELFTRITIRKKDEETFGKLNPVLSLLSFMLKAPMVPKGQPVVNSLFKQRSALESFLRALIGLPANDDLNLFQRI